MKSAKTWKVAAAVVLAAVFSLSADTPGQDKKAGQFGQAGIRHLEIRPASPAKTQLDLPPGPRTGQFFLNGAGIGVANGVHNLGILKRGQTLTIFVEGLTAGFDPTVIITAPNWARNDLTIWGADDNGDDPDPAFSITIPVSGVYTMLVAEYSGKPGWYRYSMEVE